MEDLLFGSDKDSLLSKVEKELFESRIIHLNEDISQYTIDGIVPLIQKINLDAEKSGNFEPVHMYINSFGGSAYDGWYLVSIIENSKVPIWTYTLGYAMSMGLPLFLSGKKRFLGRYATLLYHELRGGIEGTREQVKRLDKEYDRLQKIYDDYIISKTTITQDILNEHQEKVSDWYIGLEEATKYKMYDELI